MMNSEKRKKTTIVFLVTLLMTLLCLGASILKTNAYNNKEHRAMFEGEGLFTSEEAKSGKVTVNAVPRDSTWTKVFDFNNEGLTDHNYQAYTYDFTVSNNTKDEVKDFTFKLVFGNRIFLSSGWNGSVEIHQMAEGGELKAYGK